MVFVQTSHSSAKVGRRIVSSSSYPTSSKFGCLRRVVCSGVVCSGRVETSAMTQPPNSRNLRRLIGLLEGKSKRRRPGILPYPTSAAAPDHDVDGVGGEDLVAVGVLRDRLPALPAEVLPLDAGGNLREQAS